MRKLLTILVPIFVFLCPAFSETVKDREGAVRGDRTQMRGQGQWVYNDVEQGFNLARETGRPLMVVLRCVPCLACMGIDTQVLMKNSSLTSLMKQFIRVRVINANNLDLSRFQFDPDLSFTVMFFNGDGTLYGRYGSWSHQLDSQNRAVDSLRSALRGALALHGSYPVNKSSLVGKQGKPMSYRRPVDMPSLKKFRSELNWEGDVVKSCVHCHFIGDSIRSEERESEEGISAQWIYPYPSPDVLGLMLGEKKWERIQGVELGSIAASAGLLVGDELVFFDGQPLISAADVSWVLHHAKEGDDLVMGVRRKGRKMRLTLTLDKGWRVESDIASRAGTWPMRAMAFGGMNLKELSQDARKRDRLDMKKMALEVVHLGAYGRHGAAKRAGFQKGDILVMVDGMRLPMSEGEVLGYLLLKYSPGAKVEVEVLRKGERVLLQIPVQ